MTFVFIDLFNEINLSLVAPYQSSVAFYIDTSHLICTANQMTGFCLKCNTGLKSVNMNKTSKLFGNTKLSPSMKPTLTR